MIIKNIRLEGFRNYSLINAGFSDGINVLSGSNAQGKTNLLEAIYYLASGKSFRAGSEKELIMLDSQEAYLRADINSFGREQILEARLKKGKKRELFANGVKLKKASELSGRLLAVLFNPDDLDMVKSGAAVRRRLLDLCLSQLRSKYASALGEYNRLHDHKTRILRDFHEKPALLELLDDYNLRMAQYGAQLIYYRSAFAGLLSKKAMCIHHDFSGGSEKLEIKYKTVGGLDSQGKKPEELLEPLLEHQRSHRQAELRTGFCLSGPHKDDLEIYINGLPARKFASQGQARTACVSIKLAEREIHFEDTGQYPVLLLDDVLSELDVSRQGFILERIPQGQVFITCCDEGQINTSDAALFRVFDGTLTRAQGENT